MKDFFMALIDAMADTSTLAPDKIKFNNAIMLGFANDIWDYFMLVSLGMAIIYFLLEMNTKIAFEGNNLTMKSIFAPILKFGFTFFILCYSPKIIGYAIDIGNSFIDFVDTIKLTGYSPNTYATASKAFGDATSGFSILVMIVAGLFLIIAWLINMVLQLVWLYKAALFKLEVFWRIGMSPIALAEAYGGQHSGAMRWLKGTIALVVYGAALVALPKLVIEMMGADMSDIAAKIAGCGDFWHFITFIFSTLIYPFAGLGACSVVKQVIKEAFQS
jgi:hypothetical protein